jgi:hypothetical protein
MRIRTYSISLANGGTRVIDTVGDAHIIQLVFQQLHERLEVVVGA